MKDDLIAILEEARQLEREQTRCYRALAAEAELRGEVGVAERLNELHADEQHHLSRITARLLELGAKPAEKPSSPTPVNYEKWEAVVREREQGEVEWYVSALDDDSLDVDTRSVFAEILKSERHHVRELGGKWMPA